MKMKLALANVVFLFVVTTSFAAEKSKAIPAQPTSHTTKQIEGWTVRVDDRLLNAEHADLGERALKLLSSRLYSIAMVVSEKQLAGLRKINIELDYTYGDLHVMQYHPDAGWLKKNSYSEKLAKCVHIVRIRRRFERLFGLQRHFQNPCRSDSTPATLHIGPRQMGNGSLRVPCSSDSNSTGNCN